MTRRGIDVIKGKPHKTIESQESKTACCIEGHCIVLYCIAFEGYTSELLPAVDVDIRKPNACMSNKNNIPALDQRTCGFVEAYCGSMDTRDENTDSSKRYTGELGDA
jgi:hypothetical protein